MAKMKKITKSAFKSPMSLIMPLVFIAVLLGIIAVTMQVVQKGNTDTRSRASGFAPVCAMPWVKRTASVPSIRLPGTGTITAQTDSIFGGKLHQAIYRFDKSTGMQLYIRETNIPTDQRYNVWSEWANTPNANWTALSNPIARLNIIPSVLAAVPNYMPESLRIDAASDFMGYTPGTSTILYQTVWVSGLYGNFQTFQKMFQRTYNTQTNSFGKWILARFSDLPTEVANKNVTAMSEVRVGNTFIKTLWFEGDIAAIKSMPVDGSGPTPTWAVRTRKQIGLPGTARVATQSDLVAPNNLYGVPRLFNSLWLENGDLWVRDYPIINGAVANPQCPIGCVSGICN